MTTRLSLFDHPFFLGFDHFERELDRLKKTGNGYPPYNVEQRAEDALRITLAVAGFTQDELEIELENNHLTIRGQQEDSDDEETIYLHRGIAARQFQRSYVLADGIEVTGASLDNGLLMIDMKRVTPESSIRKIRIENKAKKKNGKNGNSIAVDHTADPANKLSHNPQDKRKEG